VLAARPSASIVGQTFLGELPDQNGDADYHTRGTSKAREFSAGGVRIRRHLHKTQHSAASERERYARAAVPY